MSQEFSTRYILVLDKWDPFKHEVNRYLDVNQSTPGGWVNVVIVLVFLDSVKDIVHQPDKVTHL